MSLTDEGHYGPKQLNLLKIVWGEGFLSPGGTEEIDEIINNTSLRDKSILDIGCGCGGAAFHLIKKHGAKSVQGIDPEPLVIETAKKLALKNNLSGKTIFKCVQPEPLPYDNETFDVVYSKSLLEHLWYPDQYLLEVKRILKPGGLVITIVPDWEVNYKIYFDDYTHRTPFTKISLNDIYKICDFNDVEVVKFRQLPIVWRFPILNYFSAMIAPFVPIRNEIKFLKWSRLIMLIASGRKELDNQ